MRVKQNTQNLLLEDMEMEVVDIKEEEVNKEDTLEDKDKDKDHNHNRLTTLLLNNMDNLNSSKVIKLLQALTNNLLMELHSNPKVHHHMVLLSNLNNPIMLQHHPHPTDLHKDPTVPQALRQTMVNHPSTTLQPHHPTTDSHLLTTLQPLHPTMVNHPLTTLHPHPQTMVNHLSTTPLLQANLMEPNPLALHSLRTVLQMDGHLPPHPTTQPLHPQPNPLPQHQVRAMEVLGIIIMEALGTELIKDHPTVMALAVDMARRKSNL